MKCRGELCSNGAESGMTACAIKHCISCRKVAMGSGVKMTSSNCLYTELAKLFWIQNPFPLSRNTMIHMD